MASYFCGFITSTVLFIVGIVIYVVKVKPVRQQLVEERAKRKVQESINEILTKELPTDSGAILDRLNELSSANKRT